MTDMDFVILAKIKLLCADGRLANDSHRFAFLMGSDFHFWETTIRFRSEASGFRRRKRMPRRSSWVSFVVLPPRNLELQAIKRTP